MSFVTHVACRDFERTARRDNSEGLRAGPRSPRFPAGCLSPASFGLPYFSFFPFFLIQTFYRFIINNNNNFLIQLSTNPVAPTIIYRSCLYLSLYRFNNKQTLSERCVDSSFSVFSLSSNRYSYISLFFNSRFFYS